MKKLKLLLIAFITLGLSLGIYLVSNSVKALEVEDLTGMPTVLDDFTFTKSTSVSSVLLAQSPIYYRNTVSSINYDTIVFELIKNVTNKNGLRDDVVFYNSAGVQIGVYNLVYGINFIYFNSSDIRSFRIRLAYDYDYSGGNETKGLAYLNSLYSSPYTTISINSYGYQLNDIDKLITDAYNKGVDDSYQYGFDKGYSAADDSLRDYYDNFYKYHYGIVYNGILLTAEQYGAIKYQEGLDVESITGVNYFDLILNFTFDTFDTIGRIELLPNFKLIYIVGFMLVVGIVGFITGKKG